MLAKVGFFDSSDFMPHGHCFLWYPEILWLHVISDAGIAIAYLLIPLTLIYFVQKRPDMPFRGIFILFGAFILLCAITHLMSIWTFWNPDYALEGVFKALTAVVSVSTLVVIIRLLPAALKWPSPQQLRTLNDELREANLNLERLRKKEKESGQAHLKAVVDNVIDGLITMDAHGAIISFNPACEKLFGYQAPDVMGQNVKMLMPEPYHSEHDGYLNHYNTTGEARIIGTAGREVRGRRKDGSEFPMDLSISRFVMDDGQHFCGIVRDITKVRQAEDSRQALIQKLMESNTELERFAYVASHDMQEPIRMVMNFSQIISQDYAGQLDNEGQEYLKIVQDSATRLRNMVHDLLQYSRLEHEAESFTGVDMTEKVDHVRMNLSELIRESGADLKAVDLPEVRGNPVQLLRLLQNLITNAIKYQSPERAPVILVEALDKGPVWQFSVSDNGLGIDKAFVDQVFEPFLRLHNWEHVQGSGLGLSICRKIVERHGGDIWLSSRPGEGTTVYFTLSKTTGLSQETRHDQSAYS